MITKIKNSALLILAFVFVNFTGCKEKNDCKGGLGGNVRLVAKPEHHGTPILGKVGYPDSAFVKFDTQENPGTNASDYDAIFVGEVGHDHVEIEGLKCGDYYIYVTGYDSTALERVTGGIPYSFDAESGEIEIVVPVTE